MDPDLVRAAQSGDAGALDDLIDAIYPLVRRIAGRIAGPAAEDATQEALLAIFRDLHGLRAPEAAVSWASAVTARIAIRIDRNDRRRRDQRSVVDPAVPALPDIDAFEVTDVLARLSASDQRLLVLRDLQGLSEREVSEALGVPLGTVKSRVHRARSRFRKEWNR